MANQEQLNILKSGVKFWNKWRRENPETPQQLSGAHLRAAHLGKADLSKADLTRADLTVADLALANLSGADLRSAILIGANLRTARLGKADLRNANLHGANLRAAHLAKADLRSANLGGAYLWGAELIGANLEGALLYDTVFANNDLGETNGLDKVFHGGPSSIAVDTIYKSKGKIPEVFLRGAGLPDTFIEYVRSLTGKSLEYYSCFISYSNKDQEFAERLRTDLQNNDVRCWFAPEDLKIGEKFRTRIDEVIRIHDKLLLVLSRNSIESDWVEKEVETAMEREHEQKKLVLFPVRLDDHIFESKTGWAADIRRTRHIGDFRGWKDGNSYRKAFDRLLRDLKADETAENAR